MKKPLKKARNTLKDVAVINSMNFFDRHPFGVSISIGVFVGTLVLLFLGIPTDIIENSRYMRMIPFTALDVFFLIATATLIAVYTTQFAYIRLAKRKILSTKYGVGGTFGGFFAISCPTCIQILVLIFGATAMMKYYDPLRPYVGFLSIGLISYGIYHSSQVIQGKCKSCKVTEG